MFRGALEEEIEPFEFSPEHPSGESTSELEVHRFDDYELLKGKDGKPIELGRGAMAVTYKAFDVDLHCPVTLKVISEKYLGDESTRLRFLREARAAAFPSPECNWLLQASNAAVMTAVATGVKYSLCHKEPRRIRQ